MPKRQAGYDPGREGADNIYPKGVVNGESNMQNIRYSARCDAQKQGPELGLEKALRISAGQK